LVRFKTADLKNISKSIFLGKKVMMKKGSESQYVYKGGFGIGDKNTKGRGGHTGPLKESPATRRGELGKEGPAAMTYKSSFQITKKNAEGDKRTNFERFRTKKRLWSRQRGKGSTNLEV